MDLGADIVLALPGFRAHAESLMHDIFTAYAPGEWESIGGIEEQVLRVVGTTPGKLSGRSRDGDTNTRAVTVGTVERPVVEGGLHIPIGSEFPDVGWEYELTALGPSTDPALLGSVWRVVDVPKKSFATARRLDVVEIPRSD